MSIHDGYLNDCQIVNFKGGAGSAALGACILTIMEGQGYRSINHTGEYLIFQENPQRIILSGWTN